MMANSAGIRFTGGIPDIILNNRQNGITAQSGIGEVIVTKGQSKLNDAEIKQKIKEMTKRDFETGKNSKWSNEWWRLANDYISYASPDRNGIIKNTLSSLSRRLGMSIQTNTSMIKLITGNSGMFGTRDIGSNFVNFRDHGGNLVAIYSNTEGWMNSFTPAEVSRRIEFSEMWDVERKRVALEAGTANELINCALSGFPLELGQYVSRNAPLDMEKLAEYGITYDAETGQTNIDKEKLQAASDLSVADAPTLGYTNVWFY